jgi:hypothetical protein
MSPTFDDPVADWMTLTVRVYHKATLVSYEVQVHRDYHTVDDLLERFGMEVYTPGADRSQPVVVCHGRPMSNHESTFSELGVLHDTPLYILFRSECLGV